MKRALAFTALLALLPPAGAQETAEPGSAPPAESQPPAEGEPPLETVPVDQQAPAQPEAEARGTPRFDTIEVTAQRRSERLIDVPVAVTAMTMDQIEARDIIRLDDLNALAPGLQVSRSPSNTTISQLTMRASSQINPAIYWDPAVGVYLDGAYIGKSQGAIFDIVDLAGVEVLRGPQGTLYGRNTIGGTVNFITREPSGNFNGTVAAEFGDFNGMVYRASLDVPRLWIADLTFGVRSERRDPWVTTTPTSPVDGMNNRNSDGAHVAALLDIAEGIELTYRLDWTETDQTNAFLQLVRSDKSSLQPYINDPPKQRRDTADINAPSAEKADITGHALTLSWQINDLIALKSVTGYRDVTWVDQLDLDGTPEDIAHSARFTDYTQLQEDLQVSGKWDKFTYTGGVYYFEDDGYTVNPIFVMINVVPDTTYVPFDFDSQYGTETEAWAGYGQVAWEALDPLTVTLGARYTSETKVLDRIFGSRNDPNSPYTYYIAEGFRTPEVTFKDTTPMASVGWAFTDQFNVYARYAEGFKSGGYNGEYSNVQDTPDDGDPDTMNDNQTQTSIPFRPEKQKSIEVGAKGSLLDGTALISIAAFQNKLEDLQLSIFTADAAVASVVRNAAKATVKGIEIETALVPLEGTTLRANYAFLDPSYDEFIDAVCDPPPAPPGTNCVNQNLAANRAFVHAPKNTWNLVLDSEFFDTGFGSLRAVVDYVWTDKMFLYPFQRETTDTTKANARDTEVPAHGILSTKLSLTAIPIGTRLGEVTLWGRNVLDEDIAHNYIPFGPGAFENLTVGNFVEPATFGLSAQLRW